MNPRGRGGANAAARTATLPGRRTGALLICSLLAVPLVTACGAPLVAKSDATIAPDGPLSASACSDARDVLEVEARRGSLAGASKPELEAARAKRIDGLAGLRGALNVDQDGPQLYAVNILSGMTIADTESETPLERRALASAVATLQDLVNTRCS